MKLFVVCVVLAAVLLAPAVLAARIKDGEHSVTFDCDPGHCCMICRQDGYISGSCEDELCVCSDGKINTYDEQRSSPKSIPNETPVDKPIKVAKLSKASNCA